MTQNSQSYPSKHSPPTKIFDLSSNLNEEEHQPLTFEEQITPSSYFYSKTTLDENDKSLHRNHLEEFIANPIKICTEHLKSCD